MRASFRQDDNCGGAFEDMFGFDGFSIDYINVHGSVLLWMIALVQLLI